MQFRKEERISHARVSNAETTYRYHVKKSHLFCLKYKGDEADLLAHHVESLLNFYKHTDIFRPKE